MSLLSYSESSTKLVTIPRQKLVANVYDEKKNDIWICTRHNASFLQFNLQIYFSENEMTNSSKCLEQVGNFSVRNSHFYSKNVLDHLVCHKSNSYGRNHLK